MAESGRPIAEWLAWGQQQLTPQCDSPRLEAEILLCHCLACDRSHLFAWPERIPDPAQQTCFQNALERRLAGEPSAYITGQREFWSLPLRVTPDTLIPRPETELLVEQVLACLPARPQRVLDLGTGSGAIALALASERPQWEIHASDIHPATLETARQNARQLGLTIYLHLGDWFQAVDESPFDAIVANPPYIASDDPHLADQGLPHEPQRALASGPDGLDAIRHLIEQAPAHLKPGGWLLLEHGWDQQAAVLALLQARGFEATQGVRDLAQQPRLCLGQWPGSSGAP